MANIPDTNKIIETDSRPLFGKTQKLIERIHSLDNKWYVEFWNVNYFFLGIEIFHTKKEVVKQTELNGSSK